MQHTAPSPAPAPAGSSAPDRQSPAHNSVNSTQSSIPPATSNQSSRPVNSPSECPASAGSFRLLSSINLFARKGLFRDDSRIAVRSQLTKKTRPVSLVTNARPNRLHQQQQCVRITIHQRLLQPQYVPAGLAFLPELVARSAEKMHLAALPCLRQRMWIHIPQHQHFLAGVILQDRRNQPALFFKCQLHKNLPKNKNPAAQSAPAGHFLLECC